MTVIVKERGYFKIGTLQEGLSPLLGIIMTTSGCPVMEPLKPMVRYHLPFASLEETVFRMVSMFLMAQFIRSQAGKQPEWQLDGLMKIYSGSKKIEQGFRPENESCGEERCEHSRAREAECVCSHGAYRS